MSMLFNLPMKFECTHCNTCYMHPYQTQEHHYPACPQCKAQGQLLGIAETGDLIQNPIHAMNSYLSWVKSKFTPHSH
ncbi:hypothetical protein HYG93_01830 [Acinetobacter sp. SwsAc6]|uniref:hypothetical protein n=1 Tax=Acinetobacter TaxID=469 RepID=UPI000EA2D6DB|nr:MULTISPECIES: hypothetical protein [Acinetobacter]NWK73043.1 hypothetical protein [Acinetobacter sp. SwsAc6]RKG50935.1 hypothetical protein D7V68_03295 [Acinetobacter cumulans]